MTRGEICVHSRQAQTCYTESSSSLVLSGFGLYVCMYVRLSVCDD